MRRLSPQLIEQICLSNNIIDIIGEDTFLKQTGNRYMGLCPFPSHKEKTPSFSVSSDKQLYHCFGCNQSGNILTYLQVKHGLPFIEAVQQLANKAGININNTVFTNVENTQYLENKKLLEINLYASDFYKNNLQLLSDTHSVKKYLKQRDISPQTIETFKIGYAPKKWDGLLNYLKQKSCDLKLVDKLGLIRKKSGYQSYYDLFRDRIMFPVFAKNGRDILGFGGRVLGDIQPKYINSTDSCVFHKGKTFYGWQHTASLSRDSGKVLVVEGYTDYLSLYQRGIKNVVATLGTSLTTEHAYWLSKYVQQVILFFDGDEAGIKAAERSLNVLLFVGLIPKILKLKDNQDPDTFIRENGKQALQEKAESAPDLFLYLFLKELKNYPAGVDRLNLIQKISKILVNIKAGALKEYYINRFLDSFGFDEKVAQQALEQALKQNQHKVKNIIKSKNEIKLKGGVKSKYIVKQNICLKLAPKAEISLLILALQKSQYYKGIVNSGIIKKMSHSGVIQLFEVINQYNTQELKCFEALTQILSAYLEDPRELQKEQYPSLRYLSEKNVAFFIKDCIYKIEKEKKHLILKDITTDMRLDKDNSEKYLMQIAEWTKHLK